MANHLPQIERLLERKTWQRDCVAVQVETLRWIVWQEHKERERTGQVFAMFVVVGLAAFVLAWLMAQGLR